MSDEQRLSEKGVEVTVEDTSDELEGWDKFQATAKNTSDEARTLNGNILILDAEGSQIGECTVYLELPAGETKSETFTVKLEEGTKASWSFKLVKVYEF